jgi:hypothetical protein
MTWTIAASSNDDIIYYFEYCIGKFVEIMLWLALLLSSEAPDLTSCRRGYHCGHHWALRPARWAAESGERNHAATRLAIESDRRGAALSSTAQPIIRRAGSSRGGSRSICTCVGSKRTTFDRVSEQTAEPLNGNIE